MRLVRGKAKVIVINNSWQLAPWADVLYACDFEWWRKWSGVPEFTGLKITQDRTAVRAYEDVQGIRAESGADRILVTSPGVVGWGGNSGFHALNLAVQFGSKRIILVGYDMRVDKGLHWHGKHEGLNNPDPKNVERWRRVLDSIAPNLEALGISVINASPISALSAYPKMTLKEALRC